MENLELRVKALEESLAKLVDKNGNIDVRSRDPDRTQYARVDWQSAETGTTMFNIASHVWSNLVEYQGKLGRWLHNHTSFYTRAASGSMQHALDITHSETNNQIQISLDTILKKGRLIVGGINGRMYQITVIDGKVEAIGVDSREIVKANKVFSEYPLP